MGIMPRKKEISLYRRLFRILTLLLTLALMLGLTAQAANLEDIDTLILTKDVAKIKHAIELLDKHLATNAQDGEALWLMAKAHLYLGDRTSKDDGRLEVFEMGKDYADLSVELLPSSPHTYYWQ